MTVLYLALAVLAGFAYAVWIYERARRRDSIARLRRMRAEYKERYE